jgi:protein-tyrosine phosphatase
MNSILIVCVGNICRSPVAAALLRAYLPAYEVDSTGTAAVVGHDIDPTARAVAQAAGVVLTDHAAKQFTREIGEQHDLILVLEGGHKREIERIAPALSGRIMRLSHWTGDADIPDPYRMSGEFHESVFASIKDATTTWISRL